MKNLLLLALLAISFMSCEKDSIDEPEQELAAAVLGEWELYRDENLESIIDEWTGTEWTRKDMWYQNTRENSRIIIEFRADGTFVDRYADVEVANGVWGLMDDGSYYFDYDLDGDNTNESLKGRRMISIYCNNTYAIEIEGNDRAIYYYRLIGTIECFELIEYNVE